MDVDVTTAITIDRRRSEVAEYACDPDHATEWYSNITEVNSMRSANAKDLQRLKTVLEASPRAADR